MSKINRFAFAMLMCLTTALVAMGCRGSTVRVYGADIPDAGRPVEDAAEPTSYTVGGVVSGLAGMGLVLQNNLGDDAAVTATGAFAFPTPLATGAAYSVTVLKQPTSPSQTCTVAGASGAVGTSNVSSVLVACTTGSFTVGGTVSGLVTGGSVVIQNNLGGNLKVAANGPFTFDALVASGSPFAVTVLTPPTMPTQTCAVTKGTGTMGAAKVTNVAIACTTDLYKVGGTVTGLAGTGLVLQNNMGNDLPITMDGAFTFTTGVESGKMFSVKVLTQPTMPAQTCTVSGATGAVVSGNVTSVVVNCDTLKYTVGGSVQGLAGTGLVLQNNGGNDLAVSANGTVAFSTPLIIGAAYAVTVKTQPSGPSQTCSVTQGTGTMGAADVRSVVVNCVTNKYFVQGTITGLAGSGLVLQNNGVDNLSVIGTGSSVPFKFAKKLDSGSAFLVTVVKPSSATSSPTQTCTVSGTTGAGTVGGGDVTTVLITCATNSYTVGGTVTGLITNMGTTGVMLLLNGSSQITVTGSTFTFTGSPIISGFGYAVTIAGGGQPTSPTQTCTLSQDTGTVTSSNVTDVVVNCATNSFTVGGTITGLTGTGLVLRNNGGDSRTVVPGSSNFTFATPVASGAPYVVTIFAQPSSPTQTCTVANGSNNVGSGNVTDVIITCTTNTYFVGGTVAGLVGSGLVLQNNGANNRPTNAGPFAFSTAVASGQPYNVTVLTQPSSPAQSCIITNGSGTIVASAVANVQIQCVFTHYTFTTLADGASTFIDACAIAPTTKDLASSDEGLTAPIPLPFTFFMSGQSFTTVQAHANGYVFFGAPALLQNDYYPSAPLPSTTRASASVHVYNADLHQRATGGTCYATVGNAPSRRFIVEYQDAAYFFQGPQHLTFELILNETDGSMDFVYQTIGANSPSVQATLVGMQNSTATVGTNYEFRLANAASVIVTGTRIHAVPSP